MQRVNFLRGSWQYQRTLFLVVLLVVAVDQLSKLCIRDNLHLGQSLPQEGILRLTYVTNEGVIFGLSAPPLLSLALPILVVIAALFFHYVYASFNSRLIQAAFGLIIGGSLGNLIDRIRFGHVTDFIDLRIWGDYHWPVFNLADTALVIGAILCVYSLLRLKIFSEHGLEEK